jgi:hypothetical protein
MRISIVPAQITTVEDKIAGNISVQQAALLGIPILFGFIIALVLPPSGQFVGYKIAIVAGLLVTFGSLAIRIRGRIVVKWLGLFAVYCARPQYYVYDKNSLYLRDTKQEVAAEEEMKTAPVVKKSLLHPATIAAHEFTRLEQLALDARAGMKFEVGRKGELNVRITEVE